MTTAVFKNAQTMASCRYIQAACNRNIIAALSRLFELKDMIQSKFTNRILRNSLHYVANNLHENTKKITWKSVLFYTDDELEPFRKEANGYMVLFTILLPIAIMSGFLSFIDITDAVIDKRSATMHHFGTAVITVIELSLLWQARYVKERSQRNYQLVDFTLNFRRKTLRVKWETATYTTYNFKRLQDNFKRLQAFPDILPLPSNASEKEKTLQKEIYHKIQKMTDSPLMP